MSMAVARNLFDAFLEDYPRFDRRIGVNALIVHNINFENAVVKVQSNREHDLIANESTVTKSFKIFNVSELLTDRKIQRLAERAQKRAKTQELLSYTSEYLDLRFVLLNPNICERPFSMYGYAMSERRKAMLPANFETQIFLYINCEHWGLPEVHFIACNLEANTKIPEAFQHM